MNEPAAAPEAPPAPPLPPGAPEAARLSGADAEAPAFAAAAGFLRRHWRRVAAVSAALLVPCFWQPRIQAGDLASHVYNAWLALLIERGQAPGLWLAPQSNNVLFDIALTRLGGWLGFTAAEKLAVAASVLLFFWGAFAFAGAAARRAPWFALPWLAVAAWGFTLSMGFMNFYLSLGLAFWGLALWRGGRGRERLAVLLLLPVTWAAHPLGIAVLVAVGAYLVAADRVPPKYRWSVPASAAAALLALRVALTSLFPYVSPPEPFWFYTGADQAVLYGRRYELPALLLLGFAAVCLAVDVARRRRDQPASLASYRLPLELYGLALLACWMLPGGIRLPLYAAPLSYLPERFTLAAAVFLCALLGVMQPRRWHLAGFAAVAAVFFAFLYQDAARLNRMETQAARYVELLPPNQRVAATIWPFVGSRVLIHHIVDRACIGHCFSYGNYEPSSGQFRVRASPGNPVVVADYADSGRLQSGDYVVRPEDLPLYQIYQCDLNMTELCMRELAAGEPNGRLGVRPLPR